MELSVPSYNNFHIALTSRPKGLSELPPPTAFTYASCDYPKCSEHDVIIKTLYICIDPALRCRMNNNNGAQNMDPWPLNQAVEGLGGVGVVVESKTEHFQIGSVVEAMFGWPWKLFFSVNECEPSLKFCIRKINENYLRRSWISLPLSCLGMVGITSVISVEEVGRPLPGDACVITDAIGGYGSIAGQVARILGCSPVVGICSSEEECNFAVSKFKFSAALNKNSKTFSQDLRAVCPGGVNIFIDNSGGDTSDAIILQMKSKGRVVVYDQTSPYNACDEELSFPVMSDAADMHIDMNEITRKKFFPLAYNDQKQWETALNKLERWILDGKLIVKESTYCGLEKVGLAFNDMMSGRNIGTTILKVSERANEVSGTQL